MGEDMTISEQQSFGCLAGGLTGLGVPMAAGGSDVVNIIAGGVVPIGSNLALGTALVGVIFGSFCVIGQALTPSALYVIETFSEPGDTDGPNGTGDPHAVSFRKYIRSIESSRGETP